MTLYFKVGCHLCEEMQQQLEKFRQQYDFSLNLVDIETATYLNQRYGEWIPVLTTGNQELCHYYLNEESLLEYFQKEANRA